MSVSFRTHVRQYNSNLGVAAATFFAQWSTAAAPIATSFATQDVASTLSCLARFLSLARGAACSLPIQWGGDADGQIVWRGFGSPIVDHWSGRSLTWFAPHQGDTLSELFDEFCTAWEHQNLGEPFRMALDWYRRCNARFCCNFGPATSGWTVFDNDWTGSPIMPSDNPFKWRQFEPGLILLCVRWYLRYAVSYRDLEEMMRERGLCVDHTTIYRWVQRYAPEIDKRCRPFLRRTTDSYRIDETYVRVGGAWHYLYRGVDSTGDTLDFLLRATRDRNAAIAFFRKTVGASHTTPPRVVNVDKNPAYPIAFEAIKHEGFFRPRSSLRQCKYLNNVIEQDHRFIKRRTRPMLGFKQFTTAWRTVRGIEMMHALRKGQARWMAKGDVVGQTRLIHKVFGLAV